MTDTTTAWGEAVRLGLNPDLPEDEADDYEEI